MLLLSIDSSTAQGGLSLHKDGILLGERLSLQARAHTEFMNSALVSLLGESKRQLSDIEAIACGIGPGSFTGIRVATNLAKSLSYAQGIPVFSLDTLAIMAYQTKKVPQSPVKVGDHIAVFVNAHKNMIYFNLYDVDENGTRPRFEPRALTLSQIEEIIQTPTWVVGDAYGEYQKLFPTGLKSQLRRDPSLPDYPRPSFLGSWVFENQNILRPLDWKTLFPLYIRSSEAEEKMQG